MAVTDMIPYLFFNGDAAEAVALYQKALGAQVLDLRHYDEMPEGASMDAECAPPDASRVMHAMLQIDTRVLMISDTPQDSDHSRSPQVEICLNFDDLEDQKRRFEALSEGGEITSELQDVFWGDRFGTLTDRFGIRWMFSCALPGGSS